MSIGDDLKKAEQLLSDGDAIEAERLYRSILVLDPGEWGLACYAGLARCARQRSAHAEAAGLFRRAAELAPHQVWRWNAVAEALLAAGRHAEAKKIYRDVLVKVPDSAAALTGVGRCLRQTGERELALDYFLAAARLKPENQHRLHDVAVELQALGRYDELESVYQQILTYNPKDTAAQQGLQLIIRQRDGREASLARCRDILAADEHADWARLELAEDLLEFFRLDEAEHEFRRLEKAGVTNIRLFLGLGRCARKRGDRKVALERFQLAASQYPAAIEPRVEIAWEQREAGEFQAARDTISEYLLEYRSLFPARASFAELSLAQTERAAGRHEVALAALTRAHTLNPGHLGIRVEMAATEKRLGMFPECLTHLRSVLKINPSEPSAVRLMADLWRITGNKDAAYKLYREAAEARPGNIDVQLGLTEALNACGQTSEAVAILAALENRYGLLPQLRSKRVALLRQAGFYPEALFLAREGAVRMPGNFDLCLSRFYCELLYDNNISVEECIIKMRPSSRREAARKLQCQGQAMESTMQLEEALQYYEQAADITADDSGLQNSLTRVKMLIFDLEGAARHLRVATHIDAANRKLQGKSLNTSQTHYGQLLDEYRMDDDAVKCLEAVRSLPPAQRAASVLKLVTEYPDNTGVAVALLVAMRQSGAMCFLANSAAPPIPRNIIQFWDNAPPDAVVAIMNSWRDNNQSWHIMRFDEQAAKKYIGKFFDAAVLQAFVRAREPALKADLFRLAVLMREGGVYADADDRCLGPLEALLPEGADLVLYQEDLGTIGNNFIAAIPGHPLISAALSAGVEAVNRGDADLLWLSTGPGLITRIFAQTMSKLGRSDAPPIGVAVMHRTATTNVIAMHCYVGYKRTQSHWTESNFSKLKTLSLDTI